jgi:hypothetical protein
MAKFMNRFLLTVMALATTPDDERGSSMRERFFLGGRGTSLAQQLLGKALAAGGAGAPPSQSFPEILSR